MPMFVDNREAVIEVVEHLADNSRFRPSAGAAQVAEELSAHRASLDGEIVAKKIQAWDFSEAPIGSA